MQTANPNFYFKNQQGNQGNFYKLPTDILVSLSLVGWLLAYLSLGLFSTLSTIDSGLELSNFTVKQVVRLYEMHV